MLDVNWKDFLYHLFGEVDRMLPARILGWKLKELMLQIQQPT